jgi:hypothetical protein
LRLLDSNIDLVTMNDLMDDLWEFYKIDPLWMYYFIWQHVSVFFCFINIFKVRINITGEWVDLLELCFFLSYLYGWRLLVILAFLTTNAYLDTNRLILENNECTPFWGSNPTYTVVH